MGVLGVVAVLALIGLGVVIAGAVILYVAARRGIGRLRQWGQRNQIAEKVTEQIEVAKASPLARQIMGAPSPYQYLDPSSATSRQIRSVASAMRGDSVLGRYAASVIGSLEKADFYRQAFAGILGSEFGTGTLTWTRFNAPVSEALRDIVTTSARMTNRMQVFDTGEYARLSSVGVEQGSADEENLVTMRATLGDLDRMRDANVRMLAGLGRLHAELSELPANRADAGCEELLEEIRRLSGEAKLYG